MTCRLQHNQKNHQSTHPPRAPGWFARHLCFHASKGFQEGLACLNLPVTDCQGGAIEMTAKALPKMTDVPANERTNLLKEKLAVCSVVYDFLEEETAARDMKRQVLLECIEYISKKNVLTEAVYGDALHMVRTALRLYTAIRLHVRTLLRDIHPGFDTRWSDSDAVLTRRSGRIFFAHCRSARGTSTRTMTPRRTSRASNRRGPTCSLFTSSSCASSCPVTLTRRWPRYDPNDFISKPQCSCVAWSHLHARRKQKYIDKSFLIKVGFAAALLFAAVT